MATALTVPFSVSDQVFVNYPYPDSYYFDVQTRTVSQIKLTAAGDTAVISFTSGNSVNYTDAVPSCFTTAALAAAANITDVISRSAANCVLDATTSDASTAAQASVTLGRIG